MIFNTDGLFNRTKTTGDKYQDASAKETLETVLLGNALYEKYNNPLYNQNTFLDKIILDDIKNTKIAGDVVIVNGYGFEIDRSVPKISKSLGKIELNEKIKITGTSTLNADYTKATITVEVEYEGKITEITIKGEAITLPAKQNGKYTFTTGTSICPMEITTNGNYGIIAKDSEGKINVGNVIVTDITEDMDIWNKNDMESFRDKVNSGRTFEGRTARLMSNIDLEGTEENQWIPIGTENVNFKGTFEGNYHKIKNLYIDSDQYECMGLFRITNEGSTIQNTVLENMYLYNRYNVATGWPNTGGFVGYQLGSIINCGINSGTIKSHKTANCGTSNWISSAVGGVSGRCLGVMNFCYNKANIFNECLLTGNNSVYVGGLTGSHENNNINGCYNTGTINGIGRNAFVGGIAGTGGKSISNSYNIGDISGRATYEYTAGGIIGKRTGGTVPTNSYCKKENVYSVKDPSSTTGIVEKESIKGMVSTLGDAYIEDVNNINNGYPILKWEKNIKK